MPWRRCSTIASDSGWGKDMEVDMEEHVERKKAKTKKKRADTDNNDDADTSDTIGWATD